MGATMWINIFLFVICAKYSFQEYLYQVKYLDVPVDHFSFTNNATFKLRYLVNDSHWSTDGPIFFYTGNEGDIDTFAQNTGFVWEIAPQFSALIIFAEHRYYGKSLPFGNQSFSNSNFLGYLTSQQALADYVLLIDYLQNDKSYPANSNSRNPVIAFGGSYGGMLSAWLRMKYPASVIGAIAASAPILQFQGLVPCENFNRIITSVFRVSSSGDCTSPIKYAWPDIRELTKTDEGKQWLSEEWKLCKKLNTTEDVEVLLDWLQEIYGNLAMVNYPYPTDFLAPLPANPVSVVCDKLSNVDTRGKPLLTTLNEALSTYTNYTGKVKCIETDTSGSPSLGFEAWDFQACTEMVMPMCSNNDDMFENENWNFTKYTEQCNKKWGVRVSRPDLAILEYGGRNLKTASNIVFSNGLLDPWSSGGVLHNVSDSVLAVIIPDAAHHLDLRARNDADPRSVIHARKTHKRMIHSWLRQFYQEFSYLWSYKFVSKK